MTETIRRIEYADLGAWDRLGVAAFGASIGALPPPEEWASRPGRNWGTFDDGELVARLRVYGFTSWFHGARVPTAGIAGVTVAAERRGDGLLGPLFAAALAEARERGETISTLHPTAPGVYRGLGYEVIGSYDEVELPLVNMLRIGPVDGVRLRAAGPEDLPAVEAVYARWASAQNGPLTRAEAPFRGDPARWLDGYTGVTVAVEDDEITGVVSWQRGKGYDPRESVMVVEDLVARTPTAVRALWRYLGSFASVVGRVRLSTSGLDPALLALPGLNPVVVRSQPYMLRILDVVGALDGARLAPLTATIPFAVHGAGLDGTYLLDVSDGLARVTREPAAAGDVPTLSAQGLALSYAGAQSAANLRTIGALTGPSDYDAVWSALFGGRQVHVRDYF